MQDINESMMPFGISWRFVALGGGKMRGGEMRLQARCPTESFFKQSKRIPRWTVQTDAPYRFLNKTVTKAINEGNRQ